MENALKFNEMRNVEERYSEDIIQGVMRYNCLDYCHAIHYFFL